MNKLKCGIVGYGYMGEIRKRVIESHPRCALVGIVETNKEKQSVIHGCQIFSSFEELLQHDVDIIFVCTPNRYAPALCIKSLQQGKHVFCEKPPGRTVEDVRNIIKAEKENPGVKLMFGFNHRFHPVMLRAKEIIESGQLGSILNLRGLYGKSRGLDFRQSWRNDKEISGGGILLDQGIHMLDLFRYYCGDFEMVKCFTSNTFWNFDVEDNAFVILQNKKRQHAFLHSSATMWKNTFQFDMTLTGGYMRIGGFLSKSGCYGRETLTIAKRQLENITSAVGDPLEEIIYFDHDESWDLEVQEFIRCIDEHASVTMSSSHDALRVMEIIEQAYENAQ
ncbi:MAG: Gfo/Idh/MocA family oxidoreductase [bacterium]|nr:Gfo/Idh/MocA family oxidoreductase [bacterium]